MSELSSNIRIKNQRIGVFDSGVGGLSVLREIRQLMPKADLVYLADQANLPYGPKSHDDIRRWCLAAADWLADQGCGAVVLACNTASAAALHWLREQRPALINVGMEPAVKPAAAQSRSGVVGVLATPGTLAGSMFQVSRERWASHVKVIEQPCVGWVECVEAGQADSPEAEALVRRDVEPLLEQGADMLVLGCTHFPFLAEHIRNIAGEGVTQIDPAPAIARQLQRVTSESSDYADGRAEFSAATTGEIGLFNKQIQRLTGHSIRPIALRWNDDRLCGP